MLKGVMVGLRVDRRQHESNSDLIEQVQNEVDLRTGFLETLPPGWLMPSSRKAGVSGTLKVRAIPGRLTDEETALNSDLYPRCKPMHGRKYSRPEGGLHERYL